MANAARGENLDAGKSGARLFTTNCTSCHHTPKGLVRRISAYGLVDFLQLHYTASRESARELAVYLTAIDQRTGAPAPGALPSRPAHAPSGVRRGRAPRPPVALAQ